MRDTTRNRRPRTRRGFSFMEVLLIVALASIALPRYGAAVARYRADAAARRVVADLELARGRAKAAGGDRTVLFKPSLLLYRIPGWVDSSPTIVHDPALHQYPPEGFKAARVSRWRREPVP